MKKTLIALFTVCQLAVFPIQAEGLLGVTFSLPEEIKEKAKEVVKEKEQAPVYRQEYTQNYSGGVLNSFNGVNYGPSGKETYYNLDMSGIISIMTQYGYTWDDYAVREDGVKTLGGRVMVAADLSQYPRGSFVETSLGEGIVCDTGGFVYNGSGVALDIATDW